MADITGVHHVNLSVTNLQRSRDWYCDLLGLQVLREFDGNGWQKVIMRHPTGLLFGLTQHHSSDGEQFSEFRTGLDHVAFSVTDAAELDAWEQRLTEAGIDHSPIKQSPLGQLITFRDPDNIQLEVYASNPA